MTQVQHHYGSALALLAVLSVSAVVSLAQRTTESHSTTTTTIGNSATGEPSPRTELTGSIVQTPIDPFAVLPASDALLVLDLKRFTSDVVPRLLTGDQNARTLVIA